MSLVLYWLAVLILLVGAFDMMQCNTAVVATSKHFINFNTASVNQKRCFSAGFWYYRHKGIQNLPDCLLSCLNMGNLCVGVRFHSGGICDVQRGFVDPEHQALDMNNCIYYQRTSEPNCTDRYPDYCSYWCANNYHYFNPNFIIAICPKSCNVSVVCVQTGDRISNCLIHRAKCSSDSYINTTLCPETCNRIATAPHCNLNVTHNHLFPNGVPVAFSSASNLIEFQEGEIIKFDCKEGFVNTANKFAYTVCLNGGWFKHPTDRPNGVVQELQCDLVPPALEDEGNDFSTTEAGELNEDSTMDTEGYTTEMLEVSPPAADTV